MDILIKNMEMPSCCYDCFMALSCEERDKADTLDRPKGLFNRRINTCPLVPVPKPIDYKTESDVLLKLWMDKIITDGEYNKIMERLNKAEVLEGTTGANFLEH